MASRGTVIPFRALLFVLVAVVAIPALIFSAVLLQRYANSERTRATIALEESARGIARAADGLFANAAEVLKVLGNSTRLLEGDIDRFRAANPFGHHGHRATVRSDYAGWQDRRDDDRERKCRSQDRSSPDVFGQVIRIAELYVSRVLGSPGGLYAQVAFP